MSENNLERKFIPNLENRFFDLALYLSIKWGTFATSYSPEEGKKAEYRSFLSIPIEVWQGIFRQGQVSGILNHNSNIKEFFLEQFGLQDQDVFVASEYDGKGVWAVGLWAKIGNKRVLLFIIADQDPAKGGQIQGLFAVDTREDGYEAETEGKAGQNPLKVGINIESISERDLPKISTLSPKEREYNSIEKRIVGNIRLDPKNKTYYMVSAAELELIHPGASGVILIFLGNANKEEKSTEEPMLQLLKEVKRKVE